MVIAAMAFSIFVHAQSPKEINGSGGAKEKLIGAWQLTHIDAPDPDGRPTPISQPKGMLIYTGGAHVRAVDVSRVSEHSIERVWAERVRGLVRQYEVDEIVLPMAAQPPAASPNVASPPAVVTFYGCSLSYI
jgi:hypothetical protein